MQDTVYQIFGSLSWIDWVASLTGLVYVILAARGSHWCWGWGIVSCSLWAYASLVHYQLYLDAGLQLFYVGMGVAGWYQWRKGSAGSPVLEVTRLTGRQHLQYLGWGTALALPFGYLFDQYTPAAATYWDAFTTVFAILATVMLVRRQIDNWLYWIVIDTIYIGLYSSREAWLFALLMVVYVWVAGRGYLNWRRYLDKI